MKKLNNKNMKEIKVSKQDLFEIFLTGLYVGASNIEECPGEFDKSTIKYFKKDEFEPAYKKLLEKK